MMNNRLPIAFMLALILVVALALPALAQGRNGGNAGQSGTGSCVNYVDADGDGVCDNAPQDGSGTSAGVGGYGDQDGSCDNYVDADGDGVNDNAPADGTGAQHGRR